MHNSFSIFSHDVWTSKILSQKFTVSTNWCIANFFVEREIIKNPSCISKMSYWWERNSWGKRDKKKGCREFKMACQMKRMKSPSPSVLLFTQVTPLRLAMIQPFNCIYDRRFIVSHGVNTHMAYPYGVSENPHFTFIKLPFSICLYISTKSAR